VFALLGVLVLLFAFVGLDLWSGRRLDAELARLEQRYGSLDGRAAVAPPVASSDNQARFVRAAAALVVPTGRDPGGTAVITAVTAALVRVEHQQDVHDVPGELRAFVEANADAMALIGEARRRRQSSWDANYDGGGNVPSWADVRTLGHAAFAAALVDLQRGRVDEASGRIASGFAVSASLRHEPSLFPQLIRISVALQQCEAVERLIATAEPSRVALEDLARSLADNRTPDPLRLALLGELRYGNASFVRLETGDVSQSDFAVTSVWSVWLGPLARFGRPFIRRSRLEYLRAMEALIEIQAGPRPRATLRDSSPQGWWGPPRFGVDMVAGLERAIDTGDLFNNVLGVAEAGVALRRYRLDRGSYPEDLTALVPAYLIRLPVDAVTGRPPSYARSGAGFTLKAEAIRRDAAVPSALQWLISR
jgi:hypothetical protein